MTIEVVGWWLMAIVSVACAVGMILTKNPIHATLFLVGNFIALAVIFLLLSAPMLFAVQLIVYAGAIMVLFLFVIMFFMSPEARRLLRPALKGQTVFAIVLTIAFFVLVYIGMTEAGLVAPLVGGPAEAGTTFIDPADVKTVIGNPRQLGGWMFSHHVLPFELLGVLLLIALLGVVVVARDELSEGRYEYPEYAPTLHDENGQESGEEVAK